ncbi:MAG: anhydro-N-acetylmuramic acid kinase [Bacteroidota bacterium]|nr:anhydro-N-acetylmuramic acid kinase [Bacteroidota bacterium]
MNPPQQEYRIVGMMSGTSLDGIDLACCTFHFANNRWHYQILHAETFPYDTHWKELLNTLPMQKESTIKQFDIEYGKLIGRTVKDFIQHIKANVDYIASHGHTVFHDPSQGLTLQIGDGESISNETGIPVIFDFRSSDLALGGQGAPLVPVGDKFLFKAYEACINLGGFANISYDIEGKRTGFDICPCNIALNYLSEKLGKVYDEDGHLARQGQVIETLLEQLNSLPYCAQEAPKSLGKEWLQEFIFPLTDQLAEDPRHLLRTMTEHIAILIARVIRKQHLNKILVTGGGAYHTLLIERIRELSGKEITLPGDLTIQYKEALIFAFLGVLKVRNEINVLSSVTGASRDHSAGTIVYPKR